MVSQIAHLASEPRPAGCEKLAGAEGRYRIRHGQFRVVYAVDDTARRVEAVKVGHRRDVKQPVEPYSEQRIAESDAAEAELGEALKRRRAAKGAAR